MSQILRWFFLLQFQISGHVLENRRFAILGFRLRDIFDDPSKILTPFFMIKNRRGGCSAAVQQTPRNPEAVGLNQAGFFILTFYSLAFHLSKGT